METPGGKTYRPWTPELYAQQAHAPAAKLPDDDLVFFLIDVVPKLDLAPIHAPYQDETRGAPPFDPAMMTCLGDRRLGAPPTGLESLLDFLAKIFDDGKPAADVQIVVHCEFPA